MTSPLKRAPRRTSHLYVVGPESAPTPPSEGFLISDRTHKSGAVIDYTLRRRPDGTSRRAFVIVPGYAGIKPVYGDFRDAMSEAADDDAANYRHPRSERGWHAARPDKIFHPDKIGKQAVVAMIDMMRKRFPDRKVTLVGHSMGGPNAVEGAMRRPDDVEDVVLLGSGGLEEGQNLVRLAKRMPRITSVEGRSVLQMPTEDALSIAGQALFHIMRNPWRTMGEGLDIGNRDLMINEINFLRVRHIGVHAVQLENDSFFPTDIAQRHTRGLVDSFTVIEGLDHLGPQVQPEVVAGHIMGVLNSKLPLVEFEPPQASSL